MHTNSILYKSFYMREEYFMKKITVFFLCLLICFGLVACGNKKGSDTAKESSVSEAIDTKTDETSSVSKEDAASSETSFDSENEETKEEASEADSFDKNEEENASADNVPYDFSITWFDDCAFFRLKEGVMPSKEFDELEITVANPEVDYDLPLTITVYWGDNYGESYSWVTYFDYVARTAGSDDAFACEGLNDTRDFLVKDGWYTCKIDCARFYIDDYFINPDDPYICFNTGVKDLIGVTNDGIELTGIQEVISDKSLISSYEDMLKLESEIPFLSEEAFNTILFKDYWKCAIKMKIPNLYVYDFGEWPLGGDSQSFLVTGYHKTEAEFYLVVSEQGDTWSQIVFENDTDMLNRDPYLCGYTASKADNHVSNWEYFNSYDYKMKWFVDHNARDDWDIIIDGKTVIYPSNTGDALGLLGIVGLTTADGSDIIYSLAGLESGEYTWDVNCTVEYEDFKFLEEGTAKHSREKTNDCETTQALVIMK